SFVVAHPANVYNQDAMIFVSDIPGGYGGKDLWLIEYDKKAKTWGEPQNLGPAINTAGDEMFPFVRENGDLYFASNGHPGMGGLDNFKSASTGKLKWSKPENMRAPINSPSDDFGLIMEADAEKGYFASNRPGGRGGDDI